MRQGLIQPKSKGVGGGGGGSADTKVIHTSHKKGVVKNCLSKMMWGGGGGNFS